MISLFQAIVALVLLGLGSLYYFKIRKSSEKPQEDTDVDNDPFENLEPEPEEPAKTTPTVSAEPDVTVEPEINISHSFIEKVPDAPVQPTVTTTPAQSLIPGKAGTTVSVNRSLTSRDRVIFENKIKRHFIKNSSECVATMNARLIMSIVKGKTFNIEQIKKMTEPGREEFKTDDTPNGFVPMVVMKDYGMTMNRGGGMEIMNKCR
jgi:hypothetical protein